MEKSVVKNEFECQEKCIEKESRCKSCNVYPEENDVICELNNKTRLMKAADFKKKRGSTYYGLVQVSSVVCVNSLKLRFLGSYLNSLIGDLDNSRFTKSRFRSLTTENTYIFVFLALSRKFEWKNTMGNIYFCLFFFITFSTKFEWQNTISSCLVFTLSSIFISCEEINRRIIFAVKQWNWLDGISSIYFPCLSIYQWCLLELNSCRWKVHKELSLNKVYWSQFSVSLHPSIFWFLERVSQLFMNGKFTKKYNSIET